MRKYKHGSRWAFWRWSMTASGYLTRLHLIMTPWFAICLHFIRKPDVEPWLHDHPVTFFSLVLKGWYEETRAEMSSIVGPVLYSHKVRWCNFLRASPDERHRIYRVAPRGCVTLAFMSRVKRKWGFHTDDGWVYWKDYYNEPVKLTDGVFFLTRKDFYKAVAEGRVRFDTEIVPPTHWDDYKVS